MLDCSTYVLLRSLTILPPLILSSFPWPFEDLNLSIAAGVTESWGTKS